MHVSPATGKPDRNAALDFTKGALVLFMLVYHWLNYFVSTEGSFYRYLRFVTTSFILITGFLITNVYLPQYRKDASRVARRLLLRGVKLLLLFTGLNLAAGLVVARNYNGRSVGMESFIGQAPLIYGIGKGEAAAFEILVPIAYLLLASPLVLMASRRFMYAVPGMCALAFLTVFILGAQGISSSNLSLFAIGMLGLMFGCRSIDTFNQLAKGLVWVVVAYLLYLAAISIWAVPYPMQIVGASLSVLLIYSIGVRYGDDGAIQRHIILLGQYSLLAYIAQIAALQVLRRLLVDTGPDTLRWSLSLIGVLLLTSGTVLLVDYGRARSRVVTSLYRLVLG